MESFWEETKKLKETAHGFMDIVNHNRDGGEIVAYEFAALQLQFDRVKAQYFHQLLVARDKHEADMNFNG